MKKDIVFVITSMGRGGAERVISVLSDAYAEMGMSVHIVMLWHSIVEYRLNEKVEVIDLSREGESKLRAFPRLVRSLHSVLKKNSTDSVVTFISENSIITHLACIGLKTRKVCSERIDPNMAHRSAIMKKLISFAYAHADSNVMQTERAKRYFSKRIQKKSAVIPNPVSVSVTASPEKEKLIVTAGRLAPQKNHKMLISAFAKFCGTHEGYRLEIFGDGQLADELREHSEKLGVADRVILAGNVSDLHERTAKAEMFVLSSNYEGLSNALLEAMMMGLPVISTACAGSDEAIEDGVNGLLVPVGDENALLCAMSKLADDASLRESLARAAALSAEKYKTENIINKWRKEIEADYAD